MTVIELRKEAKELKINLTQNGKYKTIKQLKNEIENHNEIEGGKIKHLGRKFKNTMKKTNKISKKISKTVDRFAPVIEMVAPELAPVLAANKVYNKVNGGSLSVKDTKDLLNASYSKKLNNINGFIIDKTLSGQRVQVYYNPNTNKAVVVHRGTADMSDWKTDLSMTLGVKGKRFSHAKKIQQQAEQKFGKENIITIGHSLGAKLAEQYGSDEIITLNKPTLPLDILKNKKVKGNQTDIKTSRDPISILRGLQKGKKSKIIKSKTYNPLKEHSVNVLDRLDGNEMLGV
jgi:hypothetical protein